MPGSDGWKVKPPKRNHAWAPLMSAPTSEDADQQHDETQVADADEAADAVDVDDRGDEAQRRTDDREERLPLEERDVSGGISSVTGPRVAE